MRKLVALSMAMAVVLLMSSCGLGKMVKKYPEVTVTLDNPDLENKGGEVAYTIKGTIPPKYMKKKATMTFTPSLSVDGEKVTPPFATIKLKGEKAKGEGVTIPYKTGGTFAISGGAYDVDPTDYVDTSSYDVVTLSGTEMFVSPSQ